jgi:hypothetical protein
MDLRSLYSMLSDDIQKSIRSHLYVWERFGLQKPVFQSNPDAYYLQIRRYDCDIEKREECFFHYYREHDLFLWRFYLTYSTSENTEDYWIVQTIPKSQHEYDILSVFVRDRLYETIPLPSTLLRVKKNNNQLKLEFGITRPTKFSPPTRQESFNVIADYVRSLSRLVEDFHHDLHDELIDIEYRKFYGMSRMSYK